VLSHDRLGGLHHRYDRGGLIRRPKALSLYICVCFGSMWAARGRSGRVVSAQAHDRQQLLLKCRLKANPRRGRITSLLADGISASHRR
jgi:hypothetical protein